MRAIILIILATISLQLSAQLVKKDTIVFSGVVFNEKHETVANSHILINNRYGTLTSPSGYFSIRVNVFDTVRFSYVGYKTYNFVVPDTLKHKVYISGVFLKPDTLALSEIVVLPYLNKDEFVEAFKNEKGLSQDEINAKSNLSMMSGSSPHMYSYMKTSGIELQMQQFNTAQEYKGLVSPDDMVGLNVAGFVGLMMNTFAYKRMQEKKEEAIREKLLEYKKIQSMEKKEN